VGVSNEYFGLMEEENIHPTDLLIPIVSMKKLQSIMKESSMSLDKLLPDGITKKYELAFYKDKIPTEIRTKYSEYYYEEISYL
jgi:hypothetical protein